MANSQVIPIRIPPLLLAAIDQQIKETNRKFSKHPYNRSSWILKAVSEKLSHALRSGKAKKVDKTIRPEKKANPGQRSPLTTEV